MSLLTPSSTPSLACWLLHLFTFWHINIESNLCLGGSVPHMISDSRPEVETCVPKNLAPAPDPMLSLSCRVLGLCKYACWRWMAVCFCSHVEFLERFQLKNFTLLGMLVCVCQLKYSKYDGECLSFRMRMKRYPMVVCCCYSKQNASKRPLISWLLILDCGGAALQISPSTMKERSAFFSAYCLQLYATMLVIVLCRNCLTGS